MKPIVIYFSMFILGIFSNYSGTQEGNSKSIYDININSLSGEKIDLNQYKGKKILFVNVASKCGFTPRLSNSWNK